jgi:hypothetical protein
VGVFVFAETGAWEDLRSAGDKANVIGVFLQATAFNYKSVLGNESDT